MPPLPLPLLLLLRLLAPPLPDFLPPLLDDPGELEIAAARLLLIPFFRRPSYCLSFLTLEPWSLATEIHLSRLAVVTRSDYPVAVPRTAGTSDGRWIAYTTSQDSAGQYRRRGPYLDIYVMHPDGSAKRRVVHHYFGAFPAWSPDGELIVFTGSRLSHPQERLWAVRPDGSGQRPLPIRGALPDWSGS